MKSCGLFAIIIICISGVVHVFHSFVFLIYNAISLIFHRAYHC